MIKIDLFFILKIETTDWTWAGNISVQRQFKIRLLETSEQRQVAKDIGQGNHWNLSSDGSKPSPSTILPSNNEKCIKYPCSGMVIEF